jgi:hypothetical protein
MNSEPQTRTVTVTTTPTNIRAVAAFPGDPAALPVTFCNLLYPSGGGTIQVFSGNPYARGTLTFESNPVAAETIDVNGTTFTFIAGASTSTNVHIGDTKEDTAFNLMQVLGASADADVDDATYQNDFDSAVINVTFKVAGTTGNAFTLADSSSSAVIASDATLTGGLGYGDGQDVNAGSDFTDVDQSLTRYAVASTGSIDLAVTDYRA